MKRYEKELTTEELANLSDEEIDYSDIPELNEDFWANARPVSPADQDKISVEIDRDVVEYFREGGPGYQARMTAILRSFVDAHRKP